MKDISEYLLTGETTVGELLEWISKKDDVSKEKIIEFIDHRFTNRYLKHLVKINSGFLKMAVCCLTIETLECFKQGRENTKERGAGIQMFRDFFTSEKLNFPNFEIIADNFYYHIRCGILHQAETTDAWRIRRDGELLNVNERCVNSNKFVRALQKSLKNYINQLRAENFDSKLWKNAIIKLEDICKNCKASH